MIGLNHHLIVQGAHLAQVAFTQTDQVWPSDRRSPSLSRITVVDDHSDMLSLMRDIFGDAYEVSELRCPASMVGIADQRPDLLIVGPVCGSTGASLSAWDIVALARRHMLLRNVPIVLVSPDVALMADRDRLAMYSDLHVVTAPFELDVVRAVVESVLRQAAARPMSAVLAGAGAGQGAQRAGHGGDGRLPPLCVHGYGEDDSSSCPACW
jgi:DNA-binding response OmpR family regulator